MVVLASRPVIVPEPTNLFNSCDRGVSVIRPVNCSGSYEFICLRHVIVNEIITLNCVYSSVLYRHNELCPLSVKTYFPTSFVTVVVR